ncbi:hypothetical protein Tco_0484867, partial [Tanacetum coccineum]
KFLSMVEFEKAADKDYTKKDDKGKEKEAKHDHLKVNKDDKGKGKATHVDDLDTLDLENRIKKLEEDFGRLLKAKMAKKAKEAKKSKKDAELKANEANEAKLKAKKAKEAKGVMLAELKAKKAKKEKKAKKTKEAMLAEVFECIMRVLTATVNENAHANLMMRFLALGWHLEKIHVTWAHLEKKRARLRLYTIFLEELCSQSVETASRVPSDGVVTSKATE